MVTEAPMTIEAVVKTTIETGDPLFIERTLDKRRVGIVDLLGSATGSSGEPSKLGASINNEDSAQAYLHQQYYMMGVKFLTFSLLQQNKDASLDLPKKVHTELIRNIFFFLYSQIDNPADIRSFIDCLLFVLGEETGEILVPGEKLRIIENLCGYIKRRIQFDEEQAGSCATPDTLLMAYFSGYMWDLYMSLIESESTNPNIQGVCHAIEAFMRNKEKAYIEAFIAFIERLATHNEYRHAREYMDGFTDVIYTEGLYTPEERRNLEEKIEIAFRKNARAVFMDYYVDPQIWLLNRLLNLQGVLSKYGEIVGGGKTLQSIPLDVYREIMRSEEWQKPLPSEIGKNHTGIYMVIQRIEYCAKLLQCLNSALPSTRDEK